MPPPTYALTSDEEVRLANIERFEAEPSNRIVVRSPGTKLHPIAAEVGRELRASQRDDYGAHRCSVGHLPYVRCSATGIERAVLIIDAITRAFAYRDIRWEPSQRPSSSRASLKLGDVRRGFDLSETCRRALHKLTPAEHEKRRKSPFTSFPLYDYSGSNEFSMTSQTHILARDTKSKKLEVQLNRAIIALHRLALDDQARDRYWAVQHQEENQRRQAALAARERAEAERKAVELLRSQAEAWRQAAVIRSFVEAAEASPTPPSPAWAAWARAKADALDPLTRGGDLESTLPATEG